MDNTGKEDSSQWSVRSELEKVWVAPVLSDAIDRLCYFLTPLILLLFALVVGTKQAFGEPIQCMTPQEFQRQNTFPILSLVKRHSVLVWKQKLTPSISEVETLAHWTEYVNDYCFVESTYVWAGNGSLPMDRPDEQKINYYQWVPIVLCILAILFHIPKPIWSWLQKPKGISCYVHRYRRMRR